MEELGRLLGERVTGSFLIATALLAGSIVSSAVIVFLRSGQVISFKEFLRFSLPRDIIAHRSARADFGFWISRKFVMLALALPTSFVVTYQVGYWTHRGLIAVLPASSLPAPQPTLLILAVFTLSMLLAYDLSYFLYHRLQHKLPILWELHKVHHSAEVMVGITKDRVHPIDEVMNKAWDGLVTGPLYGLWLFQIPHPVELTILGINIYVLRNVIMMDFVRHTHLRVSFGRILNQIVLCPHYHQLHHSTNPRHFDRNFGLMLTIWDRLFGTLVQPTRDERFVFGLPDREAAPYQTLYGLYVLPVQRALALLPVRRFRKDGPAR